MHAWGAVDLRIYLAKKNHSYSISAQSYDFCPRLIQLDILDFTLSHTVITSLSYFYQTPKVCPPLDNDPDKNWIPSVHKILVAEPIWERSNNCVREKRWVIVRLMPDNKLEVLKDFFFYVKTGRNKKILKTHMIKHIISTHC